MKKIDPTLAGNIAGDHLGRRMFHAREHAGLNHKEAAEKVGLSDRHLRRIEAGAVGMVSDPATLVRAARAYGVSEVWLYAGGMAGERLVPAWYRAEAQAA
jgi:transcriptional regulator with XRE-family HTH domain